MKTYIWVMMAALLGVGCNGQKNELKSNDLPESVVDSVTPPQGAWKVNKEFDEQGNMIRYDSIYSWSSSGQLDQLTTLEKDSLLRSFKNRFFTDFDDGGFEMLFSNDSIFSERYFNDDFFGSDFGKDFMDIDQLRQQMLERQKKFLEKYQSEFIKPEGEN